MTNTKLTQDQYWKLDTAYSQLLDDSNDYGVANGGHYILIATLNDLGHNGIGRLEAMELAEQLLSGGYDA